MQRSAIVLAMIVSLCAAIDRPMTFGIRRDLQEQQMSSGAPTPFPEPLVAAPSPYTDQQQLVLSTTQPPFNAIGQLRIVGEAEGLCSGSLIAPNAVLTAAHCWAEGAPAKNGTFSPGYSAAVTPYRPYGAANIVSVKLPTAFTTCPETASYQECQGLSDFAVMFLDQDFNNTLDYGYFGPASSTTIYTAGYPGDKCNADSKHFGVCAMWFTGCPGVSYDDTMSFEIASCVSGQGQSGSPVWTSTGPGQVVQMAILTAAPDDTQTSAYSGETTSLNVVITPERYQTISGWVASGPARVDANTSLYPAGAAATS